MQVYTVEDFREDYEHGVVGVYGTFNGAVTCLIEMLQNAIDSYKDELNAGEDYDDCDDEDEEDEEWREDYSAHLIERIGYLRDGIKMIREKWEEGPYHAFDSIYVTSHTVKED